VNVREPYKTQKNHETLVQLVLDASEQQGLKLREMLNETIKAERSGDDRKRVDGSVLSLGLVEEEGVVEESKKKDQVDSDGMSFVRGVCFGCVISLSSIWIYIISKHR
jgi:predicted component of type VI protein secretion system